MAQKNWKKINHDKIVDPQNIPNLIENIRSQKKTIVTLNGSFDLLHAGHLHILYEASSLADVFIVALNSDLSIQQYKSPKRPIIPLQYRLEMMSALACVDYVTWFSETTPIHLLEMIQPDVHVNGAEYGKDCIERSTVEKYGGTVHIVQLKDGLSTTKIIGKVLTTCD